MKDLILTIVSLFLIVPTCGAAWAMFQAAAYFREERMANKMKRELIRDGRASEWVD